MIDVSLFAIYIYIYILYSHTLVCLFTVGLVALWGTPHYDRRRNVLRLWRATCRLALRHQRGGRGKNATKGRLFLQYHCLGGFNWEGGLK